MNKARTEGVERRDTSGSLRRYLDYVYHYNPNTTNVYVRAEKVYVFSGDALVTVLNLPPRYRNAANGKARKNDELYP